MGTEIEEIVTHYVKELNGPNCEDAIHSLMETPSEAIPFLITKFNEEKNTDNQISIVHAIWQHRNPSTISFLSKLLSSDTEMLWQEALDGLITIGGNDSLLALNQAKQVLSTNNVKVRFINEAIGLINGV